MQMMNSEMTHEQIAKPGASKTKLESSDVEFNTVHIDTHFTGYIQIVMTRHISAYCILSKWSV